MAKRRAEKQLTSDDLDNLDNDEEVIPTREGMQFASPDVLATRKLAKARRSIPTRSESKPSPFAGLKFQATAASNTFGGLGSFGSQPLFPGNQQTNMSSGSGFIFNPQPNQSTTNQQTNVSSGIGFGFDQNRQANQSSSTQQTSTSKIGFGFNTQISSQSSSSTLVNGKSVKSSTVDDENDDANTKLDKKIKTLNKKFVDHLSKMITSEPAADLRSNCQEYITFMDGLEEKIKSEKIKSEKTQETPVVATSGSKTTQEPEGKANKPEETALVRSDSPKPSEKVETTPVTPIPPLNPSSRLSFGPSDVQEKRETMTSFTPVTKLNGFGSSSTNPVVPMFGFGSSAGVPSFTSTPAIPSSASQVSSQEGGSQEDDHEYVPPKNEDIKTDEEGSLYSKRIKLYYRDGKEYVALGKARFHVKKLESGKHQLIARAENSIGTVLVNMIISSIINFKRTKKDIQFVTMTKHPKTGQETSVVYLMRTASEGDATEAETKLNEFKS
jgi:hypothetical protein